MGYENHIDLSLDLNLRAVALLNLLKLNHDHIFYDTMVTTRAWYNGRERGFSLEVRPKKFASTAPVVDPSNRFRDHHSLYIVCAEHRNIDHAAIDHWLDRSTMNGPHVGDERTQQLREEAYRRRTTHPTVEGAATAICHIVTAYLREYAEPKPRGETHG